MFIFLFSFFLFLYIILFGEGGRRIGCICVHKAEGMNE